MRIGVVRTLVLALGSIAAGCGGGETVRMGYKPAGRELARAELNPDRLADYLSRSDLATVGLVRDIGAAVAAGRSFRKNVKDQRDRPTLATVFVDRDNQLHVVTMRADTCPVCNGTGTRKAGLEQLERLRVDFRCRECDGKKTIPNHVVERKYVLLPEDYRDVAMARGLLRERYYADAPADTERYVMAVASDDARERLAACIWLDRNWIREGVAFTKYKPMLDRVRIYEADDKTMVWQFWAGRNIPGEEARAYYRIYADTKTGRVRRKGFFPEN